MAQQIKKKFIADDAIDGSKLKLLEGEAVRLQTPAGEVELLKKDAQGKLVSEGEEISFKDDMEAHVESIRSSLQSNIDAEESARIADVDSEESRAMGVESSLQSQITQEISDRQADVDAEQSRAEGVESSLQAQITQEISDRIADVNEEQSRAEGVESSLQSQITQEVSDRQSEVTRVEGLLSTEESARIAGDQSLQSQIDNVLSNIDPTALDSLTEIIAAFQEADGSLQGAISTLAGNSSGNIEAEQSRAEAAEASLQAQITQEISDRQADVDAEEMRAMEVEGSLQSQLSQEISDRIADVNAEESARIAEDLTLLKLNGSRAMTGALNMGGGTPTLTTVTKTAGSYLAGTNSTIIGESTAVSFGTQVGGDFDGLDYVELEGIGQIGVNQAEIGFSSVFARVPEGMPTSFSIVAKETIGEVVDGFGTFRFYLAASSLAFFESPESLLVEIKTDSMVIHTPSFGFLNNGFNSTTENLSIFRVTSGVWGQGSSSLTPVAFYIGGIGWTFVDSDYIKGTPTVNSSGVVTYYEADNNVGWNNIQRVYQYSEKILSSSSFKITNLASGTVSTDAANYGQVLSALSQISSAQNELNVTQTGAGLSATGNYVPNMMSNFISGATSLSNADSLLDSALSQEISDRQTAVYDEQSRAETVENYLLTLSQQETSDRIADVDAEEMRAMEVEGSLQSQITQEISDRQADVDAEESRAMGVESSLQSQITQEISDRQSAISAEESARIADVDAEESRAMGVEGSLQSELDATQLGAGLASDGSYVSESQFNALSMVGVHYIMNATSLHDADKLLDANLKNTYDTLNGLINNEFQFRLDGDAAEASARAVAVQSLQSAISSEESSRIAADQSLQSQIDNVLSNLDPAALDSLTEIVAAFQSADSSLQGAISTLAGNSSGNIEAEESRAMAVEASLQSQITQEISDRIADVDAEQSRAEGVEASLQSQITQEISDRIADVDAEESRAMGVESSLQSQISQEISDRQADVDAEESRALAVEGSLQSQISQEISDRMAAVSAEESARIAEDLTFFKKDGSREMTGSIIPSVDVSFDLGSSSKRFRDLYLSGSTIDLGGVTLSNESNEFVVRDSSNNELAIVSDNVREGMVNKFFTESRVQETEMSMLDVTKSGEVVSTDSLVDAVSKLQNQMTQEISDRQDDVDAEESRALVVEGLLSDRLDVLEALAFEKESFTLGVNPTGITLAHSPKAKSTVMFVGRLALHEGLDYSISGNQVTFIGDFAYNSEDEIAAAEGDVVKVTYYY